MKSLKIKNNPQSKNKKSKKGRNVFKLSSPNFRESMKCKTLNHSNSVILKEDNL